MKDFLEAISRLIVDFSWKRLVALLLVVSFGIGALLVYERYTNSFRLERIRRSVDILVAMRTLDSAAYRRDADLQAMYKLLAKEVRAAANPQRILPEINPPVTDFGTGAKRFLSGAFLWILLALVAAKDVVQKNDQAPSALIAALIAGCVAGLIALFLPIQSAGVQFVALPLILFIVPVLVIVAVEAQLEVKRERRAQETNREVSPDVPKVR